MDINHLLYSAGSGPQGLSSSIYTAVGQKGQKRRAGSREALWFNRGKTQRCYRIPRTQLFTCGSYSSSVPLSLLWSHHAIKKRRFRHFHLSKQSLRKTLRWGHEVNTVPSGDTKVRNEAAAKAKQPQSLPFCFCFFLFWASWTRACVPRRQHDAPKIPDLHSLGTRTRAGEDVPAAGGGRQLHHEKPAMVE